MWELLTVIEVHKAVHFDRSFALRRFIGSCGLGSKVCLPYVTIYISVPGYRDISMHESDDSDGFFFLRARRELQSASKLPQFATRINIVYPSFNSISKLFFCLFFLSR